MLPHAGGQQVIEAQVQSGEGCHPAACLADFGVDGVEHAPDDRLDRLRLAKSDIAHQVEDLASGQEPVVGCDQDLEGGDDLGPGIAEAGRQEVRDTTPDCHHRVFGQLR